MSTMTTTIPAPELPSEPTPSNAFTLSPLAIAALENGVDVDDVRAYMAGRTSR
jgi:hypothetical protein